MAGTWHLAIESSGQGGSVALFHSSENNPVSQVILPEDQGSVRTLAPAIDSILKQSGLRTRQLSFVSITRGPGSFTGLRVGLTTAKMLSLASHIPIVPVDTLEVIAQRYFENVALLSTDPVQRFVTAINAFRKQVFTANWIIESQTLRRASDDAVVDMSHWIHCPWYGPEFDAEFDAESKAIGGCVTGPALHVVQPANDRWTLANSELWQPMAEQVGRIGMREFMLGHTTSARELTANYIRASAAEEKRR